MSSIASFYQLNRSDVPNLVRAAASERKTRLGSPPYDFLRDHARDLDTPEQLFLWSGYVMSYLIDFLKESGVELGEAEYRKEAAAVNETFDLTYLFTSADKVHLPALEIANVDQDAVGRFFNQVNYGFEELGYAVEEGLDVLRKLIAALTNGEVLIVHVG